MNFRLASRKLIHEFINTSSVVKTDKWQGMKVGNTHTMLEMINPTFKYGVPQSIDQLQADIDPDLPWAEDHFQERVSGIPSNPGETYKYWPYYGADDLVRSGGKFSHTYQERYWPKEANGGPAAHLYHRGIRYEYGDLHDLITHLFHDPFTRQAYLPVWFPEDTGVVHGGRVPCTLGYHFMMRQVFNGDLGKERLELMVFYYIRSCDLVRHFKNDVYLTSRLLQHILATLKGMTKDGSFGWHDVSCGNLIMHISSLHCFKSEFNRMKNKFHAS